MKILITAGGTNEKIDEVRYLTNHATGRLGKLIAENFLTLPDVEIVYVHGQAAILPQDNRVTFYPIQSVQELAQTLEMLLAEQPFDAVIHSMAVSDYQISQVVPTQAFIQQIIEESKEYPELDANELAQKLLQKSAATLPALSEKKISSQNGDLLISLAKAPKIISMIKNQQPETLLFGFKLLVDVSIEKLQEVGFNLLQKNQCDYVLANDLTTIHGTQHEGILIDQTGRYTHYSTKEEIAKGIVATVINEKRK